MRNWIFSFIAFIILILTSCSSTKIISDDRQYYVEAMGVGNDGTYVIKVTDFFRTVDEEVYLDGLKKDAVHCVIYNGIPAGNGSMRQPALMTYDTRLEGCEQLLNDFFQQKQYHLFVNAIVNSSKTISKIKGSKNYKISVIMSVAKDDLRQYLIDKNIIKPLNYIF